VDFGVNYGCMMLDNHFGPNYGDLDVHLSKHKLGCLQLCMIISSGGELSILDVLLNFLRMACEVCQI